ncbi:MAG: peptidoglycan-binding domain-containing protein [Polyangiaceae bacterium]
MKLVLRQRGAHGEPELVANAACLVHGVAAAPVPASTNERGELAVEVPVDLRELEVEVHSTGLRLLLLLGHIDSIEEPSGIRQRLAHLDYHPVGFEAGEGRLVDAFDRWAIRSFQQAEGLTVTGEADDATRARLRERFGG